MTQGKTMTNRHTRASTSLCHSERSLRSEESRRLSSTAQYSRARDHAKSKNKTSAGALGDDRQFFFVADCGAVAFCQCGAVHCHGAAGDLHPSVAALLQIGRDRLPALELCHRQCRVLVDRYRSIAALGRAYRCEAAVGLRVVDSFLLIARSDAARWMA